MTRGAAIAPSKDGAPAGAAAAEAVTVVDATARDTAPGDTLSAEEGASAQAAALARLRHELAHPPFHAVLRPEAVSADPDTGTVVIRLPYQPSFGRAASSGDVHGGVVAALIDLAGHAAVAVQIGRMAPTIDLRIDYLRPAPAQDLYATARTLKVGRAVARVDIEVRDADGKLAAAGRGAFSSLKHP